MEKFKQIINSALNYFGISEEDAWVNDKQWYHLEKGSAEIFIHLDRISINENEEEKIDVVTFVSPLFKINSQMPLEFYMEALKYNAFISDGSYFMIRNEFLQLRQCIVFEYITAEYARYIIDVISYWSDEIDDKLISKYREYLD